MRHLSRSPVLSIQITHCLSFLTIRKETILLLFCRLSFFSFDYYGILTYSHTRIFRIYSQISSSVSVSVSLSTIYCFFGWPHSVFFFFCSSGPKQKNQKPIHNLLQIKMTFCFNHSTIQRKRKKKGETSTSVLYFCG